MPATDSGARRPRVLPYAPRVRSATSSFRGHPASVPEARRWALTTLTAWGLDRTAWSAAPDRPVDFEGRAEHLSDADDRFPDIADPAVKSRVVRAMLQERRRHPAIFTGAYQPLHAAGEGAERVVAFMR